jgi:hypothetical protein
VEKNTGENKQYKENQQLTNENNSSPAALIGGKQSSNSRHISGKRTLQLNIRDICQRLQKTHHDDDALVGEITGTPLNAYMPQGWTAVRIGVEGEGMCGIHSVNYALNTEHYKTILHRGCPTENPCSHHPQKQKRYLKSQDPHQVAKAYSAGALRSISARTRRLLGRSFTPSSARCALSCFKEQHCNQSLDIAQRHTKSEEYIETQKTMTNVYRWLTETAFRQMAYVLDMDLLIFDHNQKEFNCGFRGQRAGKQSILCINWIHERHFEAISFVYNLCDKLKRCNGNLTQTVHMYGHTVIPRPGHCPLSSSLPVNPDDNDNDNDDNDDDDDANDDDDQHSDDSNVSEESLPYTDKQENQETLCSLYHALYTVRAQQCAHSLNPRAKCRTNRPMPLSLPE